MSKSQQNDPDEMSRLFVELTDDLSYARTHYPKRSVRVYLNSLAQRVFHDLYKKQRTPLSVFIKFWTTDLPLEMYRARKNLLAAFIIFAIGMLIGIVSTEDDPNFLGAVIGYDYVSIAENNIANGQPMSIYGSDAEVTTFGNIAINNMRVMIITFVLGIFFSLGSAFYLFFNSIMVGAFQWFYVVRNLTLASFLTIWIHGAFEIPCIILSAAAGMTLGNGLIFPGTMTRLQSLVQSGKRGIKMLIGIIPFIILAAFIEGYATRHTVITIKGDPIPTEWPDALKWSFILLCLAIIIGYFVIYPFHVAKKHKFSDKIEEKPKYVQKKAIILDKIKDVGEIFSDTFLSFSRLFYSFFKLFLTTVPLIVGYLFYLYEKVPYYYYEPNYQYIDEPTSHLEYLFVWNEFLQIDLFAFQCLIFSLNTFNIIYLFRLKIARTIKPGVKPYLLVLAKSIIPLLLFFGLLGFIWAYFPFVVALFAGLLSPLIMVWVIPIILEERDYSKNLTEGFSLYWKSYGKSIGMYYAFGLTLAFLYAFVTIPADSLKEMALGWFVLPLADDPQFIFITVDALFNLFVSHILFPMWILGFVLLYYSVREKDQAVGLYKKLETFGQSSKVYEDKNDGYY